MVQEADGDRRLQFQVVLPLVQLVLMELGGVIEDALLVVAVGEHLHLAQGGRRSLEYPSGARASGSTGMAEPFAIQVTAGAEADLRWFTAYARRIILDGLEVHLRYQPSQETRRLQPLRPNPVAEWELRLGDYRVLYDVDEVERRVTVQVVGEKKGNRLIVQGEEYSEHESD